MKCKHCDAEVADSDDKTLADAHWGWTLAPDPGLGDDAYGNPIPGWFYACPDHSDSDRRDAFRFARRPNLGTEPVAHGTQDLQAPADEATQTRR